MMICYPRSRVLTRAAFTTSCALVLFTPTLPAQQPGGAWDTPRALELIARARARRLLPAQDTALRNYTAKAAGFVYFYLDRRDTPEGTLIKTDQIALELYWAAPDLTKQRIVGLRDESRFPNRMYYHLDHLTVVQNGFGDIIRMGDGDEVRDVPHPAAPGSDTIYEFRLVDSLTLTLPSALAPIRVYEIQVRPRDRNRVALVGSIFIERTTADVVRMAFTFTKQSYVDRRLDYIHVSLDNALWEGRYWLPHAQALEIRRQIPELDFAAGAIIRGTMRITDYTFNDSIPPGTFSGYPVSAVSPEERKRYPFEREIYADLNEAGLEPPPDLARIREEAARLLGASRISGLPRLRLSLASASDALRYNRAEGITVGAGVVYTPVPSFRVDLAGGYAFGAQHPTGVFTLQRSLARDIATLRAYYREPRDLGIRAGVPGAINTLSSALLGDDYLDLYYATGAQLNWRRAIARAWWWETALGREQHRTAELSEHAALFDDSAQFRPVRSIDDGTVTSATFALSRPVVDARADAWGFSAQLETGSFRGDLYARPMVEALLLRASVDHRRELRVAGSAGVVTRAAPAQRLFLLGGVNTLPGYDYRAFAGTRYALLNAEARVAVLDPFVGVRLLGAAGATGGLDGADKTSAFQSWINSGSGLPVGPTDGVRTSAGAGLSLFWDILRIDVVRGLNRGRWQTNITFHRDFWDLS